VCVYCIYVCVYVYVCIYIYIFIYLNAVGSGYDDIALCDTSSIASDINFSLLI